MPVELDGIVAKLLAKEPGQRYQTAEDLLQDLEALDSQSSSSGTGRYAAQKSGVHAAQAPAQASGVHSANVTVKASSGSTGKLIAAVVVLLVLVVGGVAWWKHSPAAPAGKAGTADADGSGAAATSDKSAIIVADFVNQTGDPVFDTTLNQALAVQLGQSPVLDIVSQQHLRQSLQYLGRKPDETITPAIAREIGEREGIKAILTGTISKLGNEYLITLAAQNTATGDQIASVEAQAALDFSKQENVRYQDLVAKGAGTAVYIDTTPNGYDEDYYPIVMEAVERNPKWVKRWVNLPLYSREDLIAGAMGVPDRPEDGWLPFFYPMQAHEEYRTRDEHPLGQRPAMTPKRRQHLIATLGKLEQYGGDFEMELHKKYHASLGCLEWRRYTLDNDIQGFDARQKL